MTELQLAPAEQSLAGLELAMQELEPMEAPGFWSGFKTSVAVTAATVGAFSTSVAVSVVVTT